MVLLIDNSAARDICEGLKNAGFQEKNILIYPNTLIAHSALSSILKSHDTIIFQNDWTDNLFWK